MDSIDWNDEEVARLRRLWDEGHSTAEIGRRMGITKNAVIGKAHRLDLPARPSPIRGGGPARPRTPRAHGTTLPVLQPSAAPSVATRPSTVPAPAPAAAPAPNALHTPGPARTPRDKPCCWPLGEPGTRGFRFCDAPALAGKPYCGEHAGLAYVSRREQHDRADGASLDRYLRRLTATA